MQEQWSTLYSRDDETGQSLPPIQVKRDRVREMTASLRNEGCTVTHVAHDSNVNVVDHGIYIDGTGF